MSTYRQPSRYRKHASVGQRIGKILLVLLLLLGLAAAVFLLFLRGYVVETPEGVRLQLPFLSGQRTNDKPKESDANAVFQTSDLRVPDETLLSPLHAVRVSEDALLEDTAEEQMRKAGGNAILLDMRDETGKLHYVSKLDAALDADASASTPGLNDAIRVLNRRSGIYSIARVSCFSDAYLTKLRPTLALQRDGGVPWRDEDLLCYLSPSHPEVQQYLSDVCRELAALGFDEILLDGCAYPTKGARAQEFDGGEAVETLALHMEDFYQVMRRNLADEGIYLSIRYLPSELDANNHAKNGQSLETLLPLADRVWLEGDDEAVAEVFATRGLSCAKLSTVSILEKPGINSTSWAIF